VTIWLSILAGSMLVMSLVAFVAYGWDKRAATKDRWRVSEYTLHMMSLLGGWPGALLARRTFRHKTIKLKFRAWMWLSIAAHIVIAGGVTYAVHRLG